MHAYFTQKMHMRTHLLIRSLQDHQEITRVILCRLILNDIIIHIKFLNDIIMFSKIV